MYSPKVQKHLLPVVFLFMLMLTYTKASMEEQNDKFKLMSLDDVNQSMKIEFTSCLIKYLLDFLEIAEQVKLGHTCMFLKERFNAPRFVYFQNRESEIELDRVFDSLRIRGESDDIVQKHFQSNVKNIFTTSYAIAALKFDGSVITRGDPDFGGDSELFEEFLNANVKTIFTVQDAFAALKNDGSVVTWGDSIYAEVYFDQSTSLQGITHVEVVDNKFRAFKSDGTYVEWS